MAVVRNELKVKYDERKKREEVEERVAKYRRDPESDEFIPQLVFITPSVNEKCPMDEVERRKAISRCKVHAVIMVNGKMIVKSNSFSLNNDFEASISQVIPIRLSRFPDNIAVQVFGSGCTTIKGKRGNIATNMGPEEFLSEVFVAVPTGPFFSREDPEDYTFASITPYSTIVGEPSSSPRFTSGQLYIRAGWGDGEFDHDDMDPSALASIIPPIPVAAKTRRTHLSNVHKVSQMLKADIDPNNPKNVDLARQMEVNLSVGQSALANLHLDEEGRESGVFFNVDYGGEDSVLKPLTMQGGGGVDMSSDPDQWLSKRQKLLIARREKRLELGAGSRRSIPLLDEEIPIPLLDALERLEQDNLMRQLGIVKEADHAVVDIGDENKVRVSEFLKKIKERVQKKRKEKSTEAEYSDVIREIVLPEVTFELNFSKIFQRRSKLKPQREERKPTSSKPEECELVVQVMSALNVPMRFSGNEEEGKRLLKAEGDEYHEEERVFSFVNVRFQGTEHNTQSVEGPEPSFTENFHFSFQPPNGDYSADSLMQCEDGVRLTVFDDVADGEHRFLGTVTIPFATIYRTDIVEGLVPLAVPPLLLGYKADNPSDTAYLRVYATLKPPLPQPSIEDSSVKHKVGEVKVDKQIIAWQKAVRAHPNFKKRDSSILVPDINGDPVFICRYVRPQNPPDSFDTERMLLRFVSLIPFINDWMTFEGKEDIWCSSDQFLDLMAGDWEEHAILMCNYLLYYRKEAYVITGRAIPEGDTCYVLVRDADNNIKLFNPSSGDEYSIKDHTCPLQDIYLVFNDKNVWANIQSPSAASQGVRELSFNFADERAWMPFFHPTRFPPSSYKFASIQRETLEYNSADRGFSSTIEERVWRILGQKLEEWRADYSYGSTNWDPQVSRMLKKVLKQLESTAAKKGRQGLMDAQESIMTENPDMQSLLRHYSIKGFPLHFTFTDIESIVNTVEATEVFKEEDRSSKLALAVFAQSYPNKIVSVWVFVAVTKEKRSSLYA
uniref:C2 domain-containing protein n=1 Tax=Palpitomonas bilix TaxID=652834 RepID=A0A7S3GGL9_9EUKA